VRRRSGGDDGMVGFQLLLGGQGHGDLTNLSDISGRAEGGTFRFSDGRIGVSVNVARWS
jgi:hypothetical protein